VRPNPLRQPVQGVEGLGDGGDEGAIGSADVAAERISGGIVLVVDARWTGESSMPASRPSRA